MAKGKHSISIVVADDHPIVLSGIVNLLSQDPSFKVVTNSTQPVGALEAIRVHKPDVALIDMNMPGLSGLQILKSVVSEELPTRFILLAATLTDEEIASAVEEGVHGIILKESAPDVLMDCLSVVAAGEMAILSQTCQVSGTDFGWFVKTHPDNLVSSVELGYDRRNRSQR